MSEFSTRENLDTRTDALTHRLARTLSCVMGYRPESTPLEFVRLFLGIDPLIDSLCDHQQCLNFRAHLCVETANK